MAYNLPNLPFGDISNRTRGGMRRQGPVDRFDESVGERSRGRRIPPELLQLLMAQLMAGQGGGARTAGPRRAMRGAQQGARGQQRPMAGGAPRQRPPMGGGRPRQRPPMGGGAPRQRPPMGGGRPPVVRMEDLVRALSGRGGGASQADMPVPQARR